jgi:hypothetical protein
VSFEDRACKRGREVGVRDRELLCVGSSGGHTGGKVQWVPSRLQAQGNSVMIV